MTLLGAGFQMGTSEETPASGAVGVDMSLDEMIASRRKKQPKFAVQKSVSTVDQSIAKSRAQRNAKMNYRRGLATSSKPNAMQVEKEVQKQGAQTAAAELKKKVTVKKTMPSKTTGFARAEERNHQRENRKIVANARKPPPIAVAASGGPAPSKKAVQAAVNAMTAAGYKFPENSQVVISFVPNPTVVAPAPVANTQNKPSRNNNGGGNQVNNNQNNSSNKNNNNNGPNQNTGNGRRTRRN